MREFLARRGGPLVLALAALAVTAGGARATTGSALALTTLRGAAIAHPQALAAGAGGTLWFTNGDGGSLGRLSPAGRFTTVRSPQVKAPSALTVAPDGSVWFADGYENLNRLDADGRVTKFPVSTSVPIGGLAAARDGSVWFTTGGEWIGRIGTDGSMRTFDLPEQMRGTQGIAAGPDGAMWFTNYLGASIGRIERDGTVTTFADPRIRYPAAIVSGPDGALWFTDDSGAVGRISTAGVVTVYGSPATVGHPDAITVGPDRALWVTGRGGYLARITTAGRITTYAVPQAAFAGEIATANGSLWLGDYIGSSLLRVALGRDRPSKGGAPTSVVAVRALPSRLPRVSLVADSVGGSIWFDLAARSALARNLDLFLDPGQGRQLGPPLAEGALPETALELIPRIGHTLGQTVVMFIGHNDFYAADAQNVATADAELLAAGVTRIMWVTLHVTPDHTSYSFMNAAITAAQAADPTHVSIVDWASYSAAHPEWFQADGVHLTGDGPLALARLLHEALVRLGVTPAGRA